MATLAWNSYRHLGLYYRVSASGRVLRTVNPRLFLEQQVYIIDHAENRYVFFDPILTPLVEQLTPNLPLVQGWIALADRDAMPRANVPNLPHDGITVGELKVRGNWIISGDFKGEGGQLTDPDGWFGTGDVATIDPDGYVQLTDRLKDVIKSAGEWIFSIEIENLTVSNPDVFEAAVIAVAQPVWQERPLLIVHPKPGRPPTKQDILDFLAARVAKWWLPDDVVLVESLPHTATVKLLKTELRAKYNGHLAVQG